MTYRELRDELNKLENPANLDKPVLCVLNTDEPGNEEIYPVVGLHHWEDCGHHHTGLMAHYPDVAGAIVYKKGIVL